MSEKLMVFIFYTQILQVWMDVWVYENFAWNFYDLKLFDGNEMEM